MVLIRAEGPFLAQLPSRVKVVNLNLPSTYASLVPLTRYLQSRRPEAVISALDLTNIMTLLAKRMSGVSTRLAIRLDNTISIQRRTFFKKKLEKIVMKKLYPWADEIIAVSRGVAEDFTHYTGISAETINVIYNPIILPSLAKRSQEQLDHPWFQPGQPPVILGVGRLTYQKNFALLIQSFSQLLERQKSRLMILGEGEERQALENLIRSLCLGEAASLPGTVENPYAYMSRAAVLALSSRYEGLPTALVEALACGCPVVSTDCPSGPFEILDGGKYGLLVPVGDAGALARAIEHVLSGGAIKPQADWLRQFELEHAVRQYLNVLGLEPLQRES
jgi:glycosyltransferase involved in cell wall biosynthesis